VQAQVSTLSKGNQILIAQGLQVQGMVTNFDPFHLATYQSGQLHLDQPGCGDSFRVGTGSCPGAIPWARWVRSQAEMPPVNGEAATRAKLIALQLGDEANLNDDTTRTNMVNWFNTVRAAYPNTSFTPITNGGQVTDVALGDLLAAPSRT